MVFFIEMEQKKKRKVEKFQKKLHFRANEKRF